MTTTDQKTSFTYSASIKVSLFPWAGQSIFPDVCDVLIRSKKFESFASCATSAKSFLDDLANFANSEQERFIVASEINPAISGVETVSHDWKENELARLWLFEPSEKLEVIDAAGQLQIFVAIEPTP